MSDVKSVYLYTQLSEIPQGEKQVLFCFFKAKMRNSILFIAFISRKYSYVLFTMIEKAFQICIISCVKQITTFVEFYFPSFL